MVVPALIYLAVTRARALRGWAIPTATDIAFALAVLAVIGTHLPSGLRTFLLTLAVVDDLLAITVIALFYTDELHVGSSRWPLLPLARVRALVSAGRTGWLLLPLALVDLGPGARVRRARDRRGRPARLPRPVCAATAGRRAAGSPSISSTSSARSRPGSRCRSSPSSPPG